MVPRSGAGRSKAGLTYSREDRALKYPDQGAGRAFPRRELQTLPSQVEAPGKPGQELWAGNTGQRE